MNSHLKLLGFKVKDKVTGFAGIVTHVGVDIAGCVQAIVRPGVVVEKAKGGAQTLPESQWFDVTRLEKIGKSPAFKPVPPAGLEPPGAEVGKPVK